MLTFVPTPIGNINDLSFRALLALKNASVVLCEDTRTARHLYDILETRGYFNASFNFDNLDSIESNSIQSTNPINSINSKHLAQSAKRQFIALHSHNEKEFLEQFLSVDSIESTFESTFESGAKTSQTSQDSMKLNQKGKEFFSQNIIYISDAGMPLISDPGGILVKFCIQNKINFDILPGASAAPLAAAFSGFLEKEFAFFGFAPHKAKDKEAFFLKALSLKMPIVFFESPHRLLDSIAALAALAPNCEICACKEMSKKFQQIFHTNAANFLEILKNSNSSLQKGEWAFVLNSHNCNFLNTQNTDGSEFYEQNSLSFSDILALDLPPKIKAKLLSKISGKKVSEIYAEIIKN